MKVTVAWIVAILYDIIIYPIESPILLRVLVIASLVVPLFFENWFPFFAVGILLFGYLAVFAAKISDRPWFWAKDILWNKERGLVGGPRHAGMNSSKPWRQKWALMMASEFSIRVIVCDSSWLSDSEMTLAGAYLRLWRRIWFFLLLLNLGSLAACLIEQTSWRIWHILWLQPTPVLTETVALFSALLALQLMIGQENVSDLNLYGAPFVYIIFVSNTLPWAIRAPVVWFRNSMQNRARPKFSDLNKLAEFNKNCSDAGLFLSALLMLYGFIWFISSLPGFVASYLLLRGQSSAFGVGLAGLSVILSVAIRSSRGAFEAYLAFHREESHRLTRDSIHPEKEIMMVGNSPDSRENVYFCASISLWRPIHAFLGDSCSDLLCDTLLAPGEGVRHLADRAACTVIANRFEQWMEINVQRRPSWDIPGVRVTQEGRFFNEETVDMAAIAEAETMY